MEAISLINLTPNRKTSNDSYGLSTDTLDYYLLVLEKHNREFCTFMFNGNLGPVISEVTLVTQGVGHNYISGLDILL